MRRSLRNHLSTSSSSSSTRLSNEFAIIIIILFLIMKIIIIILLITMVSKSQSTFGDFIVHMPIPTIMQSSTMAPLLSPTKVPDDPPVTDIIETFLDIANDSLADGSDSRSLFEELDDEAFTTPSPFRQADSICLNNRSVVVLRWLQQRMYKLVNALIELVSVPLEMIRVALTAILGYMGDMAFSAYGYKNPECRHRVMCEVASFFSNYMPQAILSLFERNWDTLVNIGTRLKMVDMENEYFQAVIIGAFEANCTIYDQTTRC